MLVCRLKFSKELQVAEVPFVAKKKAISVEPLPLAFINGQLNVYPRVCFFTILILVFFPIAVVKSPDQKNKIGEKWFILAHGSMHRSLKAAGKYLKYLATLFQ